MAGIAYGKRKHMSLHEEKHNQQKEQLRRAVYTVTAEEGMESVTTKKISQKSDLAELYIYRFYEDKDNLVRECFLTVDKNLADLMTDKAANELPLQNSGEEAVHILWESYWKWLMEDSDRTLFYQRFCYSGAYTDEIQRTSHIIFTSYMHNMRKMYEKFFTVNDGKMNIAMTYILHGSMEAAARVFRGELPNTSETSENIYRNVVLNVLNSCVKFSA